MLKSDENKENRLINIQVRKKHNSWSIIVIERGWYIRVKINAFAGSEIRLGAFNNVEELDDTFVQRLPSVLKAGDPVEAHWCVEKFVTRNGLDEWKRVY